MTKQKIIYVSGNPIEPSDSCAVKLIPKLKKKFPDINFVHLDPTEELLENTKTNLIIIDTVIGIDKVTKFSDLSHWARSPRVTVHDFDLPLTLGVLKKLGKIKNITIIGIPLKENQEKILEDIKEIFITSGI